MDAKSIKRLELFEKYFPCEYKKLFLIDEKVYNNLNKIYTSSIKNWEHKGKYLKTGYHDWFRESDYLVQHHYKVNSQNFLMDVLNTSPQIIDENYNFESKLWHL